VARQARQKPAEMLIVLAWVFGSAWRIAGRELSMVTKNDRFGRA
jgi:hypothetical protein